MQSQARKPIPNLSKRRKHRPIPSRKKNGLHTRTISPPLSLEGIGKIILIVILGGLVLGEMIAALGPTPTAIITLLAVFCFVWQITRH